jgi:hypothetical protein
MPNNQSRRTTTWIVNESSCIDRLAIACTRHMIVQGSPEPLLPFKSQRSCTRHYWSYASQSLHRAENLGQKLYSANTPQKSLKHGAGHLLWTFPQRSLFQRFPTYPIPGHYSARCTHPRGARYLIIIERCNVAFDWVLGDKAEIWLPSFDPVCPKKVSSNVYERHIRRDLRGGKPLSPYRVRLRLLFLSGSGASNSMTEIPDITFIY